MNPFPLIKTFKCYFHSFLMNTIPCSKIVLSQHEQINEYGMFTYSQTRSAKVSKGQHTVPPKIPYPLVVVDFRFIFAFLHE